MRRILVISIAIGIIMAMCLAHEASAAGTSTVTVSAVVLSKNKCKFNANTALIDFGNLDPSAPANITINTTVDIVCNGNEALATFLITDNDGLHATGVDANRLQHATLPAEYIDYSFSLTPFAAEVPKGVAQTITLTGTISSAAYNISTLPGVYSDTVILDILP